jgi:hypothetical protein
MDAHESKVYCNDCHFLQFAGYNWSDRAVYVCKRVVMSGVRGLRIMQHEQHEKAPLTNPPKECPLGYGS